VPLNGHLRTGTATILVAMLGAVTTAGCSSTGAADDRGTGGLPTAVPPRVQGPALHPATVLSTAGSRITCPKGAEPTVDLEQAEFHPDLAGGTRLGRRSYRITLHGSVVNETNSPVRISGIGLVVDGSPWHPRISRPGRLGPGESQPLVVEGTFRSTRRQQARVAAYPRWHWEEVRLRPCGDRGLIKDD
jgi:hypothetical protein